MNRQSESPGQKTQFNLISVSVGSLVLFIFMAVAGGSIQAAVSMLAVLTVCTLGIGLAIWLAIAWLVGMVIVGSIWGIVWVGGLFTQNSTASEEEISTETRPQERLSTEQVALVDYTVKAKERGFSDTQIASRLQAQGWSNEEIELAQGLANVNIRRRFEGEGQ
jgi:hypothetical protein